MIQPNQSKTIDTGLKIKAGAPIFLVTKFKNLNLYCEIIKDSKLLLTFTNFSNQMVELHPGYELAVIFSNSNPNIYSIEHNLFNQIQLQISYLPNLPFHFIGNKKVYDPNPEKIITMTFDLKSDQKFCKEQVLKHVTFKLSNSACISNIRTKSNELI